jgi:homoaconitase/3-isopropylmalate dehydratase large subunit
VSPRRKIPTKAELLQLQKLYKTDEKIGERLGGVPAYLVAYWRRKKNVPRHSVPKFSEKEVRSLWERFGDDDRCGLELGISKAAFYNWRRRYGIREKPAFLKLEQLELDFPGMSKSSKAASLWSKQTLTQKIVGGLLNRDSIEVGETADVEPDLVVCDGDSSQVVQKFRDQAGELMFNTARIVLSLAHIRSIDGRSTAERCRTVRRFAERYRIRECLDHARGCCHQVVMEDGMVQPGQFCVGVTSTMAAMGAVNSLGWRVETDSLAALLGSGRLTVQVPPTIRIDITGRRSRGVYAKDVALSIVQRLTEEDTSGRVIEYHGSSVSQMTVSERFTLCGMSPATGAGGAICAFDSATRRYLTGRVTTALSPIMADRNAVYEQHYQVNIEQLPPQIAPLGRPAEIKAIAELETLPVNRVILGSAANGRFDDLRIAADILKGKKIKPDCSLLVFPASRTTYLEALKKGLIRILAEAGATIMPPGCGSHDLPAWAMPADGDRCLTTGDGACVGLAVPEKAEVYLCSPAAAAAAALKAAITDPSRYVK